jgi:DNA integrity scanning protein DisA with diadenylate cyclase activity
MAEMVEAHLLNVQREIQTLEERKVVIDTEIDKLKNYLAEGQVTLRQVNNTQKKQDAPASTVSSPSLGGS